MYSPIFDLLFQICNCQIVEIIGPCDRCNGHIGLYKWGYSSSQWPPVDASGLRLNTGHPEHQQTWRLPICGLLLLFLETQAKLNWKKPSLRQKIKVMNWVNVDSGVGNVGQGLLSRVLCTMYMFRLCFTNTSKISDSGYWRNHLSSTFSF